VKFSFISKHRGVWVVDSMCEALGLAGWYGWVTRPRSRTPTSNLVVRMRFNNLKRRYWHFAEVPECRGDLRVIQTECAHCEPFSF
jgi:hypothetical protein